MNISSAWLRHQAKWNGGRLSLAGGRFGNPRPAIRQPIAEVELDVLRGLYLTDPTRPELHRDLAGSQAGSGRERHGGFNDFIEIRRSDVFDLKPRSTHPAVS